LNSSRNYKIGLIVNPIAGMGGSVGLKGTDGKIYKKALKMGAEAITPKRTTEFLSMIEHVERIQFLVAPDQMGANLMKNLELDYSILGEIKQETTSKDTKKIAKSMLEEKVDLLVFCGGDGTARDIYDAIDMRIPVIAIPSGVKMFSSVFALNPRSAAKILDNYVVENIETEEREVLDINESSFREGRLDSKLYGYLKVPKIPKLIQESKSGSKLGRSAEENKQEIANDIIEKIENDVLYLLGPGTTVKAITDRLNLPKSLLGIDALFYGKIIASDINEEQILNLLKNYKKVKIILTPIGGQGFLLGRGNKQFTPKVLKIVGKENLIVVSTEEKIRKLDCLRVDTGDYEIDKLLKGFTKVVIGFKEELIKEII
jgi:predicted polyphosphate/ATP-dependent NAD kinase